jgi:hypothetical protein
MENVKYAKNGDILITVPKFKTHVNKTKTKKVKVNAQSIYSGMNHFTRGKIVGQLHEHLKDYIPLNLDLSEMFPITISMEIHIPPNYEAVKWIKGKLSWKPPAEDHKPSWDADNQWLWIKCFQDSLKELDIIPEDNVMYIPDTGRIRFVPVNDIEKRKLVFIISRHPNRWKKLWMRFFNYFSK